MRKTVNVKQYKRSIPGFPPYTGKGNKPGPKTVVVRRHKRSKPRK